MRQTLEDFYRAVRAAGVPVPPSGSIAASQAAALVGYGERAVLKYALSMNLANSLAEQALVEECFDQFFRMEAFGAPQQGAGLELLGAAGEGRVEAVGGDGVHRLARRPGHHRFCVLSRCARTGRDGRRRHAYRRDLCR